jgi:predicted nuclease of restriction endonuclease-like (RecB) superfamily
MRYVLFPPGLPGRNDICKLPASDGNTILPSPADRTILASALRESRGAEKLATLSPELCSPVLAHVIPRLSWTHHTIIIGAVNEPAERYFYMAMAVRERWSVRELRRQIDAALFLRYMSVKRDPEKSLPAEAEAGDLLPFQDHYVLEFLGLSEEYSELELRKAILDNLRDFFLEFGKELTFVGEEQPLTVGAENPFTPVTTRNKTQTFCC